MLFLGTMFSPIADRDAPGGGFTDHLCDHVTISAPPLGALVNTMRLSTQIGPVVDAKQLEQDERYIELARTEGGSVVWR
ncbi:hypothetical protein CR51_18795 [Caballeronia megalochromosomata]|nr:hypothetical protein CR51_18795 [Caballeronia megalochromosomata]